MDYKINSFLNFFKKIPIDIGQEKVADYTKAKLIALELAGQGEGKLALDVGCGRGVWSEKLKQKKFKVISVDHQKQYKECQTVDVNKGLPFGDSTFDLVWAAEVIEHLDSPQESIKEFNRVLKYNGKLIVTTPNSYFCLMRPFHWVGVRPNKLQNADHKHFFKLKDIKKLFPQTKIYGYFPYCLLKFKITRLVGLLSPTFIIQDYKHGKSS